MIDFKLEPLFKYKIWIPFFPPAHICLEFLKLKIASHMDISTTGISAFWRMLQNIKNKNRNYFNGMQNLILKIKILLCCISRHFQQPSKYVESTILSLSKRKKM